MFAFITQVLQKWEGGSEMGDNFSKVAVVVAVTNDFSFNERLKQQSAALGVEVHLTPSWVEGLELVLVHRPDFVYLGPQLESRQRFIQEMRSREGLKLVPVVVCITLCYLYLQADLLVGRCEGEPPTALDPQLFAYDCGITGGLLNYFQGRTKPTLIGSGRFQYDVEKRLAMVDNKPEPRVKNLRYKLYCTLVDHAGKFLDKKFLARAVYNQAVYTAGVDHERLDALVGELRKILEPGVKKYRYLRSWNGGYILDSF